MTNKARTRKRAKAAVDLAAIDKVTALLLLMGKKSADRVIKRFSDNEIRIVARSALDLPELPQNIMEALVQEFIGRLSNGEPLVGSADTARTLITGIMSDEKISEIMADLAGKTSDAIWSRFNNIGADRFADVLKNEQPQVAAFVLTQLGTEKASSVLDLFSPELQGEISRRMLALNNIGEPAKRLIVERLKHALLQDAAPGEKADQHARLGAILNQLERDRATGILRDLEASVPADAARVRRHMFGFEDIGQLTGEDRVRLMDGVASDALALALRQCDPALASIALSALSPRARRVVEAELATPSSASSKDIQNARRAITARALLLAEQSLIQIGASGDEQAVGENL